MVNDPRLVPLLGLLVGLLVLGGALVRFIWHEGSELLVAGVHRGPLAVAMLLLGVFLWLAAQPGKRLLRIGGI